MSWTAHFYDVAHLFESTLEADARVRRVLELTSQILPCDRIALCDLRATLAPPLVISPDMTSDERPALGRRITEFADLLRDDAVVDRRIIQVPMSAEGMAHLAVPLVGENQVIGVLLVESAVSAYDPKHLALLSVVAGQIAAYLTLLHCERTFARRLAESSSVIAELERAISMRAGVIATLARLLRSPLETAGIRRIADQLDDLGRIGASEALVRERERVNLARICRRVIEELETSHPTASVGFATMGDPCCNGNSSRLAQVVRELLINAVRYATPGGPLALTIDGRGSDVVLRSHNHGVIAEERAAAIFDFSPDDSPAGLGLGLFIAQRIVVDHGGVMDLVSSEGEGTTFVVRLPRGAPGPSAS
jgi:signal transduction histidine kinase